MNTDNPHIDSKCPSCGSKQLSNLGKIPNFSFFAGRTLQQPLPGGRLWSCNVCCLKFRHPFIDKEKLKRLYENGSETAWQTPNSSKTDWQIAHNYLELNVTGEPSVLDVGCFDGRFLSLFSNRWRRYGIEINTAAAEKAKQSGVEIICNNINELKTSNYQVDAVTAFDVLEHFEHPINFVKSCSNVLKPGGVLIIATGNTHSFPWRLLGARNLYAICSEHVSFINPKWCKYAANISGLTLLSTVEYRHGNHTLTKRITNVALNVVYSFAPSFFKLLRRMKLGNTKNPAMWECPPSWPSAKDHFLAVFVRQN